MKEFANWSGSIRFTPKNYHLLDGEEEISRLVAEAYSKNERVKIIGAGHSSQPLFVTDSTLINIGHLSGLTKVDKKNNTACFLGGTTIADAGRQLAKYGYQLHNIGDIDHQHLVGAFATGTHGSGKSLPNLPSMMTGCRIIDGTGNIKSFNDYMNPEIMRAMRLHLGVLGIMTGVTIKMKPMRDYIRREFCTTYEALLKHREDLITNNEMFDFYWYPQDDKIKIRTCNPVESDCGELPFAEEQKDRLRVGLLYKTLPKERTMKFDEMEYAIPYEAGPDCFDVIRKRVLDKHSDYVWWRILYRIVMQDDAYLSPFNDGNCVTIAILRKAGRPFEDYFKDIEPILRDFGGKPHWGKKSFIAAKDLKRLYPKWDEFSSMRTMLDPGNVFLNDYLSGLFGTVKK
tara:strand:- start:313 stop:1512 length:1200 start_codon:yes stop_codon:yes gene_type:complete